ncbi:NAD regulator [Alsobacter metallidurans]|uniref:NAD regulator n=1 Tax=Alsobacter metallidurans TaxID=340221 RepID=A0A917I6Y9_9HYPH|nr:NAD regulator [Alsobacter metallidurans]GGH17938.1 NAD regulator [Alsobacter metallidurans]
MARPHPETAIEIGLAAAVVAMDGLSPQLLVAGAERGELAGLPSGSFDPLTHRTLDIGLRAFVTDQSGLRLGYVEQLYTFADRGRIVEPEIEAHVVSIGYLALTRLAEGRPTLPKGARFRPWYAFFPWEDWREGRPSILDQQVLPALFEWATDAAGEKAEGAERPLSRIERLRFAFAATPDAPKPVAWDEEKVLDRYELLYEAGLLEEAKRDGRPAAMARARLPSLGEPMRFDHRRILATAMGRLRGKLKYRPVVFELLAPTFTLTALQKTVEAISGRHLHTQNFRRVVENAALVEPTGETATTGGRPAALFRFRREVVQERPAPGLKVGAR